MRWIRTDTRTSRFPRPLRLASLLALLALLACGADPTDPAPAGSPDADAGPDDVASSPDVAADAALADVRSDVAPPDADASPPDATEDLAADTADAADAPEPCEGTGASCLDAQNLRRCVRGAWTVERCLPQHVCAADTCQRAICEPDAIAGCLGDTVLARCDAAGVDLLPEPCDGDAFCRYSVEAEAFVCTQQVCDPDTSRCKSGTQTERCAPDGRSWSDDLTCTGHEACDEGACRSLCEINSKQSSFLGCEYVTVDLDNTADAVAAPHAVILSNPTEVEADVQVFDAVGQPVHVTGWPTVVAPGALATFRFDPTFINQTTLAPLLDPAAVDNTSLTASSFRFVSNAPVTAHQFNPLVDVNVFSNDASLLLPSNAVGTEYLAMSWKHRTRGSVLRGFVTVVAVAEGTTTVEITPTAAVVAGLDRVHNQAIPALAAGQSRTFTLAAGEVLNLETSGPEGADLTGTAIVADQPVSVFGGHECGNVQLAVDRCDHIETQLLPTSTWGNVYVGTKFASRAAEPDVFRVLAANDGTILSTAPVLSQVHGMELNRGQFLEFETRVPFVLTATGPVSLGHFMVGSNWPGIPLICSGPTGIGDPALTVSPPVDQFRDNYIVLTPANYDEDYLNVVIFDGAVVELDGAIIPQASFTPLADSGMSVAVVPVTAGPHVLAAEQPFGLEVYGYGCHVSYAYPGGLNLDALGR